MLPFVLVFKVKMVLNSKYRPCNNENKRFQAKATPGCCLVFVVRYSLKVIERATQQQQHHQIHIPTYFHHQRTNVLRRLISGGCPLLTPFIYRALKAGVMRIYIWHIFSDNNCLRQSGCTSTLLRKFMEFITIVCLPCTFTATSMKIWVQYKKNILDEFKYCN